MVIQIIGYAKKMKTINVYNRRIKSQRELKKAKKDIFYFCKLEGYSYNKNQEELLKQFSNDYVIRLQHPRDNIYMKIITHWMGIKGMI